MQLEILDKIRWYSNKYNFLNKIKYNLLRMFIIRCLIGVED